MGIPPPVAKELIMDYGHLRVSQNKQKSSQNIYDLFEHAKVQEVIEFKDCLKTATRFPEKQSVDVSDLLDTFLPIEKYPYYGYHPTAAYATALKGYPIKTTGFLGVGFDSVVIKLENGGALKISSELRPEDLGKRFFDMPILEEGVFETSKIVDTVMDNPKASEWHKVQLKMLEEPNRGVNYLIQPEAITEISTKLGERFRDHMPKIGQDFWDFRDGQLGYHDGRIVLLDYFAIRSKEVIAAREAAKKLAETNKSIATRLEELLQPAQH